MILGKDVRVRKEAPVSCWRDQGKRGGERESVLRLSFLGGDRAPLAHTWFWVWERLSVTRPWRASKRLRQPPALDDEMPIPRKNVPFGRSCSVSFNLPPPRAHVAHPITLPFSDQ